MSEGKRLEDFLADVVKLHKEHPNAIVLIDGGLPLISYETEQDGDQQTCQVQISGIPLPMKTEEEVPCGS